MAIPDEHIRLILDLKNSGASQETIDTIVNYRKSLKEAATDTDALTKAQSKQAQGILYLSNAYQDFETAGLRGVLNNINQIATTFGLGSAFAGGLTFALVTFEALRPAVTAYFKGLIDGINKVPESIDKIERLNEQLKDNKDILDDLRKKQTLTNTELVTYNKLTGENIELTKNLTAAKKAQAEQEKLAGLRKPGESEAEKGRAEELQALFGGQQGTIAAIMERNLDAVIKEWEDKIRAFQRGIVGKATPEQVAKARRMMAERTRLTDLKGEGKTQEFLAGAMASGSEEDIRSVISLLTRGGGARKGFESVLPEFVQAQQIQEDAEQAVFDERSRKNKLRHAKWKKDAERKKMDDEADARRAEENREQAESRDKEEQAGIEEGRRIGEMLRQKRAQPPPRIDTEKLMPLQDPNQATSQLEFNQITNANLAITAHNQEIIGRQNFQARQILQDLRQAGNTIVGRQGGG